MWSYSDTFYILDIIMSTNSLLEALNFWQSLYFNNLIIMRHVLPFENLTRSAFFQFKVKNLLQFHKYFVLYNTCLNYWSMWLTYLIGHEADFLSAFRLYKIHPSCKYHTALDFVYGECYEKHLSIFSPQYVVTNFFHRNLNICVNFLLQVFPRR